MSDQAEGGPNRMAEVLRLSEALSHRILNGVLIGHPIPYEQATALARAARLLQEHEIPWPTVLQQALHEAADQTGQAEQA